MPTRSAPARECRREDCGEPRVVYPNSLNGNGLCARHESERVKTIKARLVEDPENPGTMVTANVLSSRLSRRRKSERAAEDVERAKMDEDRVAAVQADSASGVVSRPAPDAVI